MTTQSIINTIENIVGATSFSLWTIGVTNDPDTTKAHYENVDGNTRYWSFWETPSPAETKFIINYFASKGMRLNGSPTDEKRLQYVYVF